MRNTGFVTLVTLLGIAALTPFGCVDIRRNMAREDPNAVQDSWQTKAERTDYQQTGRYDDVVSFCRRLADASPSACYTSFGQSGQGRELPLLILSKDRAFTPEAARAAGKLLVLMQNCIHPGECAGKDASLELARDILITGRHRHLLDDVNLLIMPILNADGHERFSPYSRINQNGPQEMGWRVTSTNLNVNRDYMKADTPEMRAWLRVWVAWQPDLLMDNHTTDGGDHQYDLLYAVNAGQLTAEPIRRWTSATLLPAILPALEAAGHKPFPYGGPRNRRDPSEGINAFVTPTPRFSNAYGAICNRPAILVEVHALKPYAQRVRAAYDIMLYTLEELNRRPEALRDAIRAADQQARTWRGAASSDGEVALQLALSEEAEPIVYHAVEQTVRSSAITGGEVIEYSDQPLDVPTKLYDQARISRSVAPPVAYLVPPQWSDVIERLELHGVAFFRLAHDERLDVESYRFDDVTFPARPYEGRFLPSYKTTPTHETRDFVAGTVVVPLDQRLAKVAVHLLEPEAPDSLLAWGFFNAIFEQKEYAEDYIMEPIAQRMLEEDLALRREFEEKLKTDEEFAKNPSARLDFFYRRSPYWDKQLNVYPVARLTDAAVLLRLVRAAPR